MPAALAALTMLGLLSGLLGDGPWDVISWLALGALPAVIGWHALRGANGRRDDRPP